MVLPNIYVIIITNSPSFIIDIATPSSSPHRESQPNLSIIQLNDMFKGFLKHNLEADKNMSIITIKWELIKRSM